MMTLRERLLQHLQAADYVPADESELAGALRLNKKERRSLAFEVRRLLATGDLIRVKGDKLCQPGAIDLVTGRISFRQNGSALVIPETKINQAGPRQPAVFISAEDTHVALHGDRVVVRLSDSLPRKEQPRAGRVI